MPKPTDPKADYFSILQWIVNEEIVNEKGEALDFYDHPFLLDILTDWNPKIVVKACAQVGKSVTFILKTLFAIKFLHFNVIYTFPTDDDVREFVSSKVNKIIQANKHQFEGMDTDSIERKEINDRFIFFKGTVSKTAAISNSADLLIHDEASRSAQPMLETYKSRTKASEYKGRWLFSNPTTEKDTLDQEWHKSNQSEWCITCPHCKEEQYMVFPDSVNLVKRCFQCRHCKVAIDDDVRRGGRWVAQNPDSEISGYHISHLIAPRISAAEIIDDSEGDQEYFHNFVLGEPYNPGDLSVSKTTILDNWTPKNLVTGKYYLGVDVGNIKHYVLGSELGVIKVGRFSKWEDLDDMMAMYKPTLVIDANPDNTMARYFVEKYQNASMSVFKEHRDNPKVIVWWGKGEQENDRKGIVYSDRNPVLDQLIDYILNAKMLFGIPSNKDLVEYLRHWETLRRVKEVTTRGIERYVWESTTGQDHYVFATLYYYLALLGEGAGIFFGEVSAGDKESVLGADNVYDISKAFSDNNANAQE